jgi:hypothetical protein
VLKKQVLRAKEKCKVEKKKREAAIAEKERFSIIFLAFLTGL